MKRSEIKRRPLADSVLASLEPETTEYRQPVDWHVAEGQRH